MKKLIILIFFFTFTILHSQEVKIAKGNILLDGMQIGKIERIEKGKHLVTDRMYNSYAVEHIIGDRTIYLNIKDQATGKNNNIVFSKYIKLFLRRTIAEELIKQAYLTKDGFDLDKMEELLNTPKSEVSIKSLSEKYFLTGNEIANEAGEYAVVRVPHLKSSNGIRVSVNLGETPKSFEPFLSNSVGDITYFNTLADVLNYFDSKGFELVSSDALDQRSRYILKRKKIKPF